MSEREELIEKAAMAIEPWAWGTNLSTKTSQAEARRDAEAAFKVFEEAHASVFVDDEHEDIARIIDGYTRRPAETARQVEPTDAQVLAALNAWHQSMMPASQLGAFGVARVDQMRAALRSASNVNGDGR